MNNTTRHYLKLQLFCKDNSDEENYNIYILYLCSIDGLGKEFIDHERKFKPEDFETLRRMIERPDTVLHLLVKAVKTTETQVMYFIMKTALNI